MKYFFPPNLSFSFSLFLSFLFCPFPTTSEAAVSIDPQADEVLHQVSDLVAGAETLVSTSETHILIQAGKMKNETVTQSRIIIRRPNLLFMEVTGGKLPFSIVSDGTHMTTLIPALTGYTVKDAPDKLIGAVEGIEGNLILQQASFQTFLLNENPYSHFVDDSSRVEYLGRKSLGDVSCHRIRIHQKQSFMDLYIDAGKTPVIRRIQPDTTALEERMRLKMPGIEIEMWVDFQGWDINPDLPADTFTFVPPDWASQKETFISNRPPNPAVDLVGKPAPPLRIKLLDGGEFDLTAIKGKKIVILDFWSTRCPPCVVGLPVLEKVADEYKEKNVELVAVNIYVNRGDTPEVIDAFRKKYNLDVNVGLDSEGVAGTLFRVTSIPQTVLVGKDGVVQKVYVGIMKDLEAQKQEYRRDLDRLLAGENLF